MQNTQHPSVRVQKGFNRFVLQFLSDLTQWLFFMLYLSLFRIAFIAYFRTKITSGGIVSIIKTLLNGMRYDSMVSTYWILIPFLVAGIPSGFFSMERFAAGFRRVWGGIFLTATTIVWVITFGYFKEYDEQFNYILFNLYYDDAKAIFKTIWADYHPLPVLAFIAALAWLAVFMQKRFLARREAPAALRERSFSLPSKLLIVLLILGLLVAGSRGSFGRRPAQRKDAAISRDEFLNKSVVNPYFSLLFAVQDQEHQTGLAGLDSYLPDRDVRKAAQELFHDSRRLDNLDEYFEKRAKGPKAVPPRHIFLVVMESYDAWAFLPKYASLGLTRELSSLGDKGLRFRNFLPASDGTMQSLTAIITSIPYSHVEINYQMSALKPYPSSLFEAFKRLGYRTRLFYGGYLSWQRFGEFARDQGADEIYGAPHMSHTAETHEWGVDDEYLFDFILKTVDDSRPSFNLIMTTSYHPPYNIDVWSQGFPLREVPKDIQPLFSGETTLRMLGHLWYSDKCIGDFVRKAETGLTRPLFAFTGDHFGRKHISANPEFYERSAVPFILYGRETVRGLTIPSDAVGAHIDIGPTLIELAAPRNFEYWSVGHDLLAPQKDSLGIGFFRVIGKNFLLELSNPPRLHPVAGQDFPKQPPDIGELKRALDRAYGVGWWRVRRGPDLTADAKSQIPNSK